jgi:hypothetical protein
MKMGWEREAERDRDRDHRERDRRRESSSKAHKVTASHMNANEVCYSLCGTTFKVRPVGVRGRKSALARSSRWLHV